MRYFLLLFPVIGLLACSGAGKRPSVDYSAFNPAIHYAALGGKTPVFIRMGKAPEHLKPGMKINKGDSLGRILPKPFKFEGVPQPEVIKADTLYLARRYHDAAQIYGNLWLMNTENVFLLEKLGRAQFWYNKRGSFLSYKMLFLKLERWYKRILAGRDNYIVIDLWFDEANWKLGCLHLDRREWHQAIYRISIALMAGLDRYRPAHIQALGYLTEAYYHLENRHHARYFYTQTKKLDPSNRYVEQYRSVFQEM